MTLRALLALSAGLLTGSVVDYARADDVQAWTGAGLTLSPVRKLDLQLEPQLRFNENVSKIQSALTDTGVRYNLSKRLRLGAGYRIEYQRYGGGPLAWGHRVHFDIEPSVKVAKKIRFRYRLRLQEEFRPSSHNQERAMVRNRVKVAYQGWKRWRPTFSGELFFDLGDFDRVKYDWLRLTFGARLRLKKHNVEAFYAIELPGGTSDSRVHIIGVTYHYKRSL